MIANGTAQWAEETPGRILIVKLDEIGDMIYTLHVLESLRTVYPSSELTLLCKPVCGNLVEPICLDRISHSMDILKEKFDVQIDLRGTTASLLSVLRGNSSRYLDRGTVRLRQKIRGGQLHERLTNWEIVRPLLGDLPYRDPQVRPNDDDEQHIGNILSEFGSGRFVVMHSGANAVERRWPAERFRELGEKLHSRFGLKTILCGGPDETPVTSRIAENSVSFLDLAGQTTLRQLFVLCGKASLFIGNESGPLHLATVAGTPLVALFGPGVPNVFYPYGEKTRIIHPLDRPVEERIASIEVEEVYRCCEELLA